jgi:hypothetical protein
VCTLSKASPLHWVNEEVRNVMRRRKRGLRGVQKRKKPSPTGRNSRNGLQTPHQEEKKRGMGRVP